MPERITQEGPQRMAAHRRSWVDRHSAAEEEAAEVGSRPAPASFIMDNTVRTGWAAAEVAGRIRRR